jgi:endonuclease-8
VPEGDTIVRTARRLEAALAGKALTRVEVRRATGAPAPGVTVTAIEPHGKHVLVRFDDGTTLRTPLRMQGRWDVYARGARWRRPAHRARVILEAADGTAAVCFDAPEVELLRDHRAERDRLGHLGPDLCRADVDLDAVIARWARLDPTTELGVALLDQRVACGVGNVYKSEVCFACGLDPFTPVGALDAAARTAVVTTAARLLQANLGSGRRTTVPGGLAVYGRADRPCRRCGTRIRARRQGEHARTTCWCPTCQPAPRGAEGGR